MNLLAIDPGSAGKGNACAAFDGGVLVDVWFERVATLRPTRGQRPPFDVPAPDPRMRAQWRRAAGVFGAIVIERPEQQGQRTRVARPRDLMALCWSGALLAGSFAGRDACPILELTPSEWKGAEPKPAQHRRMWRVLTPAEQRVLGGARVGAAIEAACEKAALKRWAIRGADAYPKSFDTHNLLDACALGCYYLGRLPKVG